MSSHIDYFVSLNSPWTHLGAARLEAMVTRHGATLRIYPVAFSTIFSASGGLPLPKRSPQRQAYRLQELARWRDHLGISIHLRPRFFPSDEGLAARCVIAARETIGDGPAVALAHRVLRALWEEERDPGEREVLATLIGEVGLSATSLLALAAQERWAEQRVLDTQSALARGVFGAPSYVIGEDIFWGQDRLEFLERRLSEVGKVRTRADAEPR
ncbi:2-hydroxychromene-2-carboxylate isomerase [Pseudoroseomonas globiformis]|uniref:2-hydroxychromene-2-carboxylate isomerase n=1 Tax=Teichococcus globiformis TaxID=2307229 RepID=A0ABV7G3Y9_9PROT